eukprot:CAMPEP_0185274444 /NCGR_PEP_ID=MMETSP1359-20130426/51879_1 /TAXON_ID=552665 /ORGANISM="Bigelowiella longifila, Strain CCMP242" /LENGTH=527 /DNA_ID=CAMNT_0027867425 /DNA_START=109 /DNA_END=1692 /DNA_ORIENTATION=-
MKVASPVTPLIDGPNTRTPPWDRVGKETSFYKRNGGDKKNQRKLDDYPGVRNGGKKRNRGNDRIDILTQRREYARDTPVDMEISSSFTSSSSAPVRLDRVQHDLLEPILVFLWPHTGSLEASCKYFHRAVKRFCAEKKVLDLSPLPRPSITMQTMLWRRFRNLRSIRVPLEWFEQRMRKGRDLVDMRTGKVSGWEVLKKSSFDDSIEGLSTLRTLITQNQLVLEHLQLAGKARDVTSKTCQEIISLLAECPLPNMRCLDIGPICASRFTKKFCQNFSQLLELTAPFTNSLLPFLPLFPKLRSLELLLNDALTMNTFASLLNTCSVLESLKIACDDPDFFLIQCEHLENEEICHRKHTVRHEKLRTLTFLDIRSNLPTMIMPNLEVFHWALCSECVMNAVAHDFGRNVINALKVRGEIPQSYGGEEAEESEEEEANVRRIVGRGGARDGVDRNDDIVHHRQHQPQSTMTELKVNGFFLTQEDILRSLPKTPKLKELYLDIGEPNIHLEEKIWDTYPRLRTLRWNQHNG